MHAYTHTHTGTSMGTGTVKHTDLPLLLIHQLTRAYYSILWSYQPMYSYYITIIIIMISQMQFVDTRIDAKP